METSAAGSPEDPVLALAEAKASRQRLTAGLRLPVGFHEAVALAIAVQIGTAGYGIAQQTRTGLAVLLGGLAFFLALTTVLLVRFRQINGARLDGLASQLLLGTGTTASLFYVGSLAAAIWAAFGSRWWLVATAALVGGFGYVLGARSWWQAYRHDPTANVRGVSPWALAALGLLACVGMFVLLVMG